MSIKSKLRRPAILLAALALIAAMAVPALAGGRDANDDRIPDKWEKNNGLSLKVDQSRRDQDRDGLKNLGEYRHHSDPLDDDSDDDGVEDGDDDSPDGDDGPGHDIGDDHGDDGPNHT